MKSGLAEQARLDLADRIRRMSEEERLAAYYRHCQLMTELYRAGRQADRDLRQAGRRDAG